MLLARRTHVLVLSALTALALSACGDKNATSDEAAVISSAIPSGETTLTPEGPFADLPIVNFAELRDCAGQLATVDVLPVFTKTIDGSLADDWAPVLSSGACAWLYGASEVRVVAGWPDQTAALSGLAENLDAGTSLDNTAGYSAAWTNEYGVTHMAIAPDGRALTCGFQQLSPSDENGDVPVTADDMVSDVSAVCAEVLTLLAADPDDVPASDDEAAAAADLPEIPSQFYLEPFASDCEKFEELDTSQLLGSDVTLEFTPETEYEPMTCDFRVDPDGPGDQLILQAEWASEPSGTRVGSRELQTTGPWDYAHLEVFEEDIADDGGAGSVILSTVDQPIMLRFICRYVGEYDDAELTDEQELRLLDGVADLVTETTDFCTRALSLAIAQTPAG